MTIENIKVLLVKANCSSDLVDSICEAMEQYKAKITEQADLELQTKIKAVKKAVLEEVEDYKLDLAKRVQLFCESKSQTIEEQLMRRSAAGETEAQTNLRKITAVLEGVELDGKPNSEIAAKLADADNTINRLNQRVKFHQAKEKRALQVAESVIKQNQKLILENQKVSKKAKLVNESVRPEPVSEIMVPPKTKVAKPQAKPQKLVTESRQTETDIISQIADSM